MNQEAPRLSLTPGNEDVAGDRPGRAQPPTQSAEPRAAIPDAGNSGGSGGSGDCGDSGGAELVRRARSGDARAWEELVRAYSGRVFGLLHHQCRDRDLAEELTQATFVKLVDKLGGGSGAGAGYDERGRFESWLFRIATNALRDELRRRQRHARPMDMSPVATSGRDDEAQAWAGAQGQALLRGPEPGPDPAEAVDRAEQLERLRQAVAKLPEADRQVLHLRHTAGLSFAEIAETIDAPLGTVLARAHRALGKLRKLLPELADDSLRRKP